MKTAFIASEYNPFHNGHLHHITETRKNGADAVVCVMSGNFVQRGDIAVASKHIRAKTAVLSGADLVLELPLKYAVSTASLFAEGFVKTVKASGLDGFISFGSNNSADELKRVSEIIYSAEAEAFSAKCISDGINYPKSKALFLQKYHSEELCRILDDANNVLALEYINAVNRFYPGFNVFSVKREGTAHDSNEISGNITSAGNIRRMLYNEIGAEDFINNIYSFRQFTTENAFNELMNAYSLGEFPADIKKFEIACFSRLYNMSAEDFSRINNVNGGLENRIFDAVSRSSDFDELYNLVKTKAFTHSRLRQIILSAALGINRDDLNNGVSYIRVLAFNDKGRALLNEMREAASLPIITNLSQVDSADEKASRDAFLDKMAGKLYNLCLPCPKKGNPEYDTPPVYIKE